MKISLTILFMLFCVLNMKGTQKEYTHFQGDFNAQWIIPVKGLYQPLCTGVYQFRKEFEITEKPDSYVIHISADSRYRLYVNGQYIGNGPVLADVANWQYDSYDIGGKLSVGSNAIAVEVWNYRDMPWAQISLRTALIVQGNSIKEEVVNTDNSWWFKPDKARTFLDHDESFFPYLMGVGNGESYKARNDDKDWMLPTYSNTGFLPAVPLEKGLKKGQTQHAYYWSLIPRTIPYMEERPQRFSNILLSENVSVASAFISGDAAITIPAHTECKLIFDQGHTTTAYPLLFVSGGKESQIQLIYAESFFDKNKNKNPLMTSQYNQIIGFYDMFYPSGKSPCDFSTLRFRTFRYVQLNIKTQDEALILHDFSSIFTAYPFEKKSSFSCSDTLINRIFEYGWNTARLCAHENYFDCPYYEQQQYFGDLNVSNPITVMLSGDARLMKNTILYGNSSRLNGDLTMCAYPGHENKIIPSFSLSWIDIINKYILFTGDTAFAKQMLPGLRDVLHWFEEKLNANGMLGIVPYWNFIDCTSAWGWNEAKGSLCEAPCSKTGNSAILTLQYIWGLQQASNIYAYCGLNAASDSCNTLAEKLKTGTFTTCWDKNNELLMDCPAIPTFSQHTNILGILTGTIPKEKWNSVLDKLLNDKTLIQASAQFRVYLHQVFARCKRGELFVKDLEIWKKLIIEGFTTFPEYPHVSSRSYTHAWNAYPTYELLTMVCGFMPTKPGMTEFIIEPDLGKLDWARGSLYTKHGNIEIEIHNHKQNRYSGTCFIPEGVKAILKVNHKEFILNPGKHSF